MSGLQGSAMAPQGATLQLLRVLELIGDLHAPDANDATTADLTMLDDVPATLWQVQRHSTTAEAGPTCACLANLASHAECRSAGLCRASTNVVVAQVCGCLCCAASFPDRVQSGPLLWAKQCTAFS